MSVLWPCPACGGPNTHVSANGNRRPRRKVTPAGSLVIRYRVCPDCGHGWYTVEIGAGDARRFLSLVGDANT